MTSPHWSLRASRPLWLLTLAAALLVAQPVYARAQESATAPQPPAQHAQNLDQIKKALGREPVVDLDEDRLRFYASVIAKAPMTFAEYAKGYDLWNGPTKGGNPMTHQEFINMVTPKELYGSGGITASELLQFSITSWLAQTLLRRGLEELKEARTEKEAREIRERIDRELRALRTYEGN
jgi:hypothetical protein